MEIVMGVLDKFIKPYLWILGIFNIIVLSHCFLVIIKSYKIVKTQELSVSELIDQSLMTSLKIIIKIILLPVTLIYRFFKFIFK